MTEFIISYLYDIIFFLMVLYDISVVLSVFFLGKQWYFIELKRKLQSLLQHHGNYPPRLSLSLSLCVYIYMVFGDLGRLCAT